MKPSAGTSSLNSPVEMARGCGHGGHVYRKLKTFNAGVKGLRRKRSAICYGAQKHAEQLRIESLASGEIDAVQSPLIADNTPLNSQPAIRCALACAFPVSLRAANVSTRTCSSGTTCVVRA